jgi:hypothetical protein
MPPISIVNKRQNNFAQDLQLMNQSIANLSNVLESQRQKNEQKNIANIISSVNPTDPSTGKAKSPFDIQREITTRINLDRAGRGKPGILNILDTTALPQGPTPIEQVKNKKEH